FSSSNFSCPLSWSQLGFFFFSSRRRHTRFSRDWSSDVCSSDRETARASPFTSTWVSRDQFQLDVNGEARAVSGVPPDYFAEDGRSEERRVGKESTYPWGGVQSRLK